MVSYFHLTLSCEIYPKESFTYKSLYLFSVVKSDDDARSFGKMLTEKRKLFFVASIKQSPPA